MRRPDTNSNFVSEILAELGSIPRTTLISFGVIGLLAAAMDLASWPRRPEFTLVHYLTLALVGVSFVVSYSGAMRMIGLKYSHAGMFRFVATSLAVLAPVGAALLFLGMVRSGPTWAAAAAAASFIATLAFVFFLPGWPVLQATSRRFVGPWAAFKLTKGIRLQLVLASLSASGLEGMAPSTSKAENIRDAAILAALNGAAYAFSLVLAVAIAVFAWRHMTANAATEVYD